MGRPTAVQIPVIEPLQTILSAHHCASAAAAGEPAELVGLTRVPVAAGATVRTHLDIGPDVFHRWDADAGSLRPLAGDHVIYVSTDSTALGAPIPVRIFDGVFAVAHRG